MTKKKSDTLRVNMAWKGEELANLRECQAMLRLNDESGAIRYLVSRGMEALSVQLENRRTMLHARELLSPQQLLPLIDQNMKELER